MKKLVLFAAVVAAVSFAACKKAAVEQIPAEVEEVTVVEETPVDATEDAPVLEEGEVVVAE